MREINPKETTRAYAFELWMKAPMPMVTFFKTLDVSRLVKISKKSGMKFNMLMCWCIGKAASGIKEFYMLPVGDKLMQYDAIAVNTIVMNKDNEVSSCDVPFSDDLQLFNEDYLKLTTEVAQSCENHDLTESMVIGTSPCWSLRPRPSAPSSPLSGWGLMCPYAPRLPVPGGQCTSSP